MNEEGGRKGGREEGRKGGREEGREGRKVERQQKLSKRTRVKT